MAKKYAPAAGIARVHVGQEILDHRPSDPLRAFGLGYLSHLAADTIAHNFFVPRQLVADVEHRGAGSLLLGEPLRDASRRCYARGARCDHEGPWRERRPSRRDHFAHAVQCPNQSPAVPRHGASHESQSWQWVFQVIAGTSRWDLADSDIEKHMAVAFEYVMETLGADASDAAARRLDPAGEKGVGDGEADAGGSAQRGGRHEPVDRRRGNGATTLWIADTGARLLETVTGAAPLAGELGGELFLEDTLGELGIGLPLRRAHHLPQEKRHQLRFTILVTAHLRRMRPQDVCDPPRHDVAVPT